MEKGILTSSVLVPFCICLAFGLCTFSLLENPNEHMASEKADWRIPFRGEKKEETKEKDSNNEKSSGARSRDEDRDKRRGRQVNYISIFFSLAVDLK